MLFALPWDAVNIVYVRDGRVVGQWAQPDLYGMRRQLLGDADSPATPAAKEAVTGGD